MNRIITAFAILVFVSIALTGGACAYIGFRGSTWGELRYEIPRENGENNLLLDGWIRQGVDLAKWGNTTLNTYATLRYRWDTEQTDWHNSLGPGLGIALEAFTAKGLVGSVGAEYIWERFYETGINDEKLILYVGWYGWWDLKSQ
jgi:hypothetical protein